MSEVGPVPDDLLHAAQAIRNDRVHGAMELAVRAVDCTVGLLAMPPRGDIRSVVRALATARPSMAAIANAVALTLAPVIAAETRFMREDAEARKAAWASDNQRILDHASLHIPKVLLTYSHASTTRFALLALHNRIRHVVIPEGRPIDDGKAFARILAAAGIPVTVITDAQMGTWVPQVEAVIVGADTVTPEGDVVNHMGTATLALLARAYGKPMYALTHSLKVAPYDRPEDMREENDPAEIWADPPVGITIRNPAFDRTPADQITIITERGILTEALRATIVAEHRAAWRICGLGPEAP